MSINSTQMNPLRPIFRWAGGKQRIAASLVDSLPDNLNQLKYIEPFFGAGSVFFRARPKNAVVGDLNDQLMQAYSYTRDMPEQVQRNLQNHIRSDSKFYYYQVRDQYNRLGWSSAQAARFIYLNRTCFNGIFRVNRSGKFNVPYGHKSQPIFPTKSTLIEVAAALRNTKLVSQCFRQTLCRAANRSFVYLDPPYPPLNGTAYFTHYTKDRFTEDDQCELAEVVIRLHNRGAKFMMSNADTRLIRSLYRDYRIDMLEVTRFITCKSQKHSVGELLIRNY